MTEVKIFEKSKLIKTDEDIINQKDKRITKAVQRIGALHKGDTFISLI